MHRTTKQLIMVDIRKRKKADEVINKYGITTADFYAVKSEVTGKNYRTIKRGVITVQYRTNMDIIREMEEKLFALIGEYMNAEGTGLKRFLNHKIQVLQREYAKYCA